MYQISAYAHLGEFEGFDVIKAFLEMRLDSLWVFGLAQDFKKVVVGQEVEPGEDLSLCLKIHIQGLLNFLQLAIHGIQLVKHAWG